MESDAKNDSQYSLLASLAPVVVSAATGDCDSGVFSANKVVDESQLSDLSVPTYQKNSNMSGIQQQQHFMSSSNEACSPVSQKLVQQQQISPEHVVQPTSYDEQQQQQLHSTPVACYQPASINTYTTLTPFQPLPPISTVSDKFNNASIGSGFSFLPNHATSNDLSVYAAENGTDIYSLYKDVCSSSNAQQQTVQNCLSTADYQLMQASNVIRCHFPPPSQPQYSLYPLDQPLIVKTEMNASSGLLVNVPATVGMLPTYDSIVTSPMYSRTQQQQSVSSIQHESAAVPANRPTVISDVSAGCKIRIGSPDQPSSSTDTRGAVVEDDDDLSRTSDTNEEINTREVAVKISNELKKYSIPQAVFAQRVLGRSQGTLSDLLRNPKPWSKLKSGRETFRRMWKWLQEPEYQRMAALRVIGSVSLASSSYPLSVSGNIAVSTTCVNSSATTTTAVTGYQCQDSQSSQLNYIKPALIPSKRNHDGTPAVTSTAADSQSPANSSSPPSGPGVKKPRMVFTEIQRRTLVAIFKEIKRPSKEIQATIAEQLGLKVSTVVNFFMNARRRSVEKYLDETLLSASASTGSATDTVSSSSSGTAQ